MLAAADRSLKKTIINLYLLIRSVILLLFNRLVRRQFPTGRQSPFRNILFIRVDRIGDMVLSTPALSAIKAWRPEAHLTVLASVTNAPVLKNNPDVDEVLLYPSKITMSGSSRLVKELKGRRFDLAIDPYDDYELKTAWLAWRSGASYRIGYERAGREVFFNGPTLKMRPNRHFVDTALDLLGQIGCPPTDRKPVIYLDEEERQWADSWLKERNLGHRPLLGIHPGGHYETQRWPVEYYSLLVGLIIDHKIFDIIVFGNPAEKETLEEIAEKNQQLPQVFADADMRRFFALLSRCRLLICNNSGPLHCAVALGVPTISFMGPTDKNRWYPLGEGHLILRRDNLSCIGCLQARCPIKTHECLYSIHPDEVWRKIAVLLLKQPRGHLDSFPIESNSTFAGVKNM